MTVRILEQPANIFESGAAAIVIPVNCTGATGKGLALLAASRYPDWAAAYKDEAKIGEVKAGHVYAHLGRGSALPYPHHFLSFATKRHWRDPSQLRWIESGLHDLVAWCRGAKGVLGRGVAVPALGCGEGGLAWDDVRPLMERILGPVPVEFMVYAPHEAQRSRAARRG